MILVFGKDGQVARELQAFKNIKLLDRTFADLRNPKICVDVIQRYKPNAVINAAAFTSVDKAESEKELVMMVNGYAPALMITTCAELNIPFIQISTDYVFEGNGTNAWKPDDLTNPQNVYGLSKLVAEKEIIKSGAIYAILRTSWIVSAYGNNFVKTMLDLSESRKSLNVICDQVGGPTPAKDIANACIRIAEKLMSNPEKSGVYHLSGTPDVSWQAFAKTIFELAGRETIVNPILTSEYPTPAKRPLNSRLDCSLIAEIFNISRPRWRDGLEDILSELEKSSATT